MTDISNNRFFTALRGWQSCAGLLVVIIAAYVAAFRFSGASTFVQHCPSQYAAHILALLTTASTVTVAGYVVSAFLVGATLAEHSTNGARPVYLIVEMVLLVVAASLAGATSILTWDAQGVFGRIDAVDALPVALATLAVVASILDGRAHGTGFPKQGKAIDVPLLVGLVLVLIAKYVVFERSHSSWEQWMTTRSYFPSGYPHGWETSLSELVSDMRSGFWIGLSMGVVAVQMIVATLGVALLRMER